MSISSYWCQMFILPKKVLKEINSVCRAYLCHGDAKNTSPVNVGWPNVCTPKKSGDLGIRNLEVLNVAAVFKIAWHISTMQDSLWVKWIHKVYMKGGRWKLFNPLVTSSWAFKKMCSVKDKLWDLMEQSNYSISKVYQKLQPSLRRWTRRGWFRHNMLSLRWDSSFGSNSSTNSKPKTAYSSWV